jgi:hypothetical protein
LNPFFVREDEARKPKTLKRMDPKLCFYHFQAISENGIVGSRSELELVKSSTISLMVYFFGRTSAQQRSAQNDTAREAFGAFIGTVQFFMSSDAGFHHGLMVTYYFACFKLHRR